MLALRTKMMAELLALPTFKGENSPIFTVKQSLKNSDDGRIIFSSNQQQYAVTAKFPCSVLPDKSVFTFQSHHNLRIVLPR